MSGKIDKKTINKVQVPFGSSVSSLKKKNHKLASKLNNKKVVKDSKHVTTKNQKDSDSDSHLKHRKGLSNKKQEVKLSKQNKKIKQTRILSRLFATNSR